MENNISEVPQERFKEPVVGSRLSLHISSSGLCSRRKADELIDEGKVKVNGKTELRPFYRVLSTDAVKVNGKLLIQKSKTYMLFNKPPKVTTTRHDTFAEKTVMDFLPPHLRFVYPVGRLDKDSCGLLVLTNDGEFCHHLAHPSYKVEKEYFIKVRAGLNQEIIDRAIKGVVDDGEFLNIKRARIIHVSPAQSSALVVITEGKKRHLRRLFGMLGCTVQHLQRVRIGNLRLNELKEGAYALLSREKIEHLVFSPVIEAPVPVYRPGFAPRPDKRNFQRSDKKHGRSSYGRRGYLERDAASVKPSDLVPAQAAGRRGGFRADTRPGRTSSGSLPAGKPAQARKVDHREKPTGFYSKRPKSKTRGFKKFEK